MIILDQAKEMSQKGMFKGEMIPITFSAGDSLEDLRALHDIVIGPYAGMALIALQRAGFFDWLIPAINDGIAIKSSKKFKEIWPHTIRVVGQTPPRKVLRWAALFHDLGKAKAFKIKDGKVTFHQHEKISAKIFDSFSRKSEIFEDKMRRRIRFLISNLGYIESYESSWTESAVRRFVRDVNAYAEDLFALSEADITTGNPQKRQRILRQIEELKTRILAVQEKDAKKNQLPKGLGNEIARALSMPLGPEIGKIRKELERKVETGELSPNQDYQYYIDHIVSELLSPKGKSFLSGRYAASKA